LDGSDWARVAAEASSSMLPARVRSIVGLL
jgi:hypothetical protein